MTSPLLPSSAVGKPRVLNWQTLLAIDSDKWAAETYRANFPGVRVECDKVADFIGTLPAADVILGGPPCQPFSDAGENEGESDDRNGIPDFIAAVEKVRPRMFLMENVRGLLKEKHLAYFGRVLGQLEGLGYVVQYRLLDSVDFGVPQFRERVWVWGIRNDVYAGGARHCWPKRTHIWPPPVDGLFGAPDLLAGVTVGQALELSAGPHTMISGGRGRRSHDGTHLRGPLVDDTDRPSWTIDGTPPSVGAPGPTAVRIIGGGTNPNFPGEDRTERDITNEPSTTIAAGHTHNALPAIHEYRWSDAMLTKHPPASPASPAPTVQAKWFKGGAEGLLSVDGRTWESRHPIPSVDEPMPTVRARSPRDGGRCTEQVIRVGPMVRRLTPLECLRLQSGHDDFRWPEKIPKTAMYRVVGNGWSSKMGAVFADAFRRADPISTMVIDLFCGGGLGATGWHSRYWSAPSESESPK